MTTILQPVSVWRHSFDVRHEKTDLKVFVVVIPKEGWAQPLWYDTHISEFDSADIIDYILEKLLSCQKKDEHGHARPSSSWHDNDKGLFSRDMRHLLSSVLYNSNQHSTKLWCHFRHSEAQMKPFSVRLIGNYGNFSV